MYVLGIETSCDETAAGVVGPEGVRSDVVHTQRVHEEYLGVVPELAARAHLDRVAVTARAALDCAGLERPDAVAATAGPGLVGALLVGLPFGKALALGWGVPFVAVNHLEGHLLSPMLEGDLDFPFLALVVSGGHTTLYLAEALGRYPVLATTADDAAGEAFDKVARLLGLGYPGGPRIERLAREGRPTVDFPRPRSRRHGFSFSGLKTAVRTHLQQPDPAPPEDVAASFQQAVVDVLEREIDRAVERTGVRTVAVSGGVAANGALRERLLARTDLRVLLPPRSRCTDNASMIAHAGRLHLLAGRRDRMDHPVRPSWTP